VASTVWVPSVPLRVTAVTSCPRARASAAIRLPIIPVAPINAIRMWCLLESAILAPIMLDRRSFPPE
jgi:hypothetical protein